MINKNKKVFKKAEESKIRMIPIFEEQEIDVTSSFISMVGSKYFFPIEFLFKWGFPCFSGLAPQEKKDKRMRALMRAL